MKISRKKIIKRVPVFVSGILFASFTWIAIYEIKIAPHIKRLEKANKAFAEYVMRKKEIQIIQENFNYKDSVYFEL